MQHKNALYTTVCNKGKLILFHSLLAATLFSCNKKDFQDDLETEKNVTPEAAASITLNPNLLFQENFDGTAPLSTYIRKQVGTSYGLTTGLFNGENGARFELRDTDPIQSGGTRTEIKFPILTEINPERWYSWSVFFPSADYQPDSSPEIINQWHQGSGESPSIAVGTRSDRMVVDIHVIVGDKNRFDIGPIIKDKWQSFVLHIIHSHGTEGLIEIWQNGSKVFTRKGANSYDFSQFDLPYWKLGIYKWDWNGTGTTDTHKRVIYFDNIKLGNANATYNDMISGNAPNSPAPIVPAQVVVTPPVIIAPAIDSTPVIPSPVPVATETNLTINNFMLINAGIEKDIIKITDGATYSLKQLATSRLNIRANPASTVGSVKFELSGAQNRTFVDNALPYALMGDDGNGNYYAGTWNPPPTGTYTLKATPYSGAKATGTAGTASVVHFTITQ